MKRIHLTLPFLIATASVSLAQDASLYEDVANPDASFVRVIDASGSVAVKRAPVICRGESSLSCSSR